MKRIWMLAAVPLGLTTACVADDSTIEDTGDDVVPELEGTWGSTRVMTPDGPMTASYQVIRGHAIHEGDMDLGTLAELRQRGGAINLGERWPNARIRYAFDPGFTGTVCNTALTVCSDVRDRVRAGLATLEAMSPIDMIEVSPDAGGDMVIYRFADIGYSGGLSSHTGREGGIQYVRFSNEAASIAPFRWAQPSNTQLVIHETLHAAGMFHEQSRQDRDAFVEVHPECATGSDGNFAIKPSTDVGPYDYGSIMHYSATQFCARLAGVCLCPPLTAKVPGAVISPGSIPSVQDMATLYRIYADPLGSNEANDHYGKALAAGDFDGDGFTDLAVGVPDEDLGSAVDAGAVMVFRGSVFGLQPWRLLTAASFGGQSFAAGDHFGAAVVAYELDTGTPGNATDLAIGVPGRAGGAGAVFVFRGTRNGDLVAHRVITQSNSGAGTDEASDGFGTSLAAGRITGMAVDTLVVGAPSDRVPALFGSTRAGAVYLFQETTSGSSYLMNKPTRIYKSLSSAGDDFGAALAVGDLDDDGKADLVVGAPGRTSGAGGVTLFQGRQPTENIFAWSDMVTSPVHVASGLPASRFGSALAIGNLYELNPGRAEIAVGAPAYSSSRGRVRILTGGFSPTTLVDLTDSDVEANDRFGAAVAIGQVSPTNVFYDYLFVGVPGENSSAGKVARFVGSATGPASLSAITPQASGNSAEAGDELGSAFAFGDFDRTGVLPSTAHTAPLYPDLVIGVPGEGPDYLFSEDPAGSGAVMLMRGTSTGPAAFATYHQERDGGL